MRIAVTGGSGRIGTAVAKRLIESKHEVIVLDRRAPRIGGARFIFLDLRNREVLQPAIEGCDAVIHLGELPHQHAGESPQHVYATNCAIGSTVMQTAADLKIARFIYTSSCQAYGMWGGDVDSLRLPIEMFPMNETQPLRPLNPYGLAKASNEQFASIMSQRHGMSVAIFRLPHVLHQDWVERWVKWERKHGVDYASHPDGFWTFVYIEDVADAYSRAVESSRSGCEAYHLTADDIVGETPFGERLKSLNLTHLPPIPNDWPARASPLTTAKSRDHFGWRPQHAWASLAASVPQD